ncbi:MAG: single-stranded DNA-binding protein [Rickettsiales bacterium]|nr:single-stranded DNA-binding protein [Rickettsiales bacterium]|tara:strand:+ start:2288 stop:2755 length:468 start_codon:yes stop_codon:yes gene_type:complete
MAYAVNKVILLGNLGKDPEVRYTKSGKAVTSFSLATSERAGRDGNERTEWHNIVAWDKLAELCGRLVRKGNKVYVEGRLQTREYEDRDGNKRWSTEVVAREMVFLTTERDLGGSRGRSAPHPADAYEGGGGGAAAAPRAAAAEPIPYSDDEDIPF